MSKLDLAFLACVARVLSHSRSSDSAVSYKFGLAAAIVAENPSVNDGLVQMLAVDTRFIGPSTGVLPQTVLDSIGRVGQNGSA